MSLFIGIGLIFLTVVTTAISALVRIRKNEDAGPGWRNLTRSGILLFVLFLITIPLSVIKVLTDENDKTRSEARLQQTLDKYGLTLAELKDGKGFLAIKDLNLLYQFINRSTPPTRSDSLRIIHDTIYIRGKDSIIIRNDTVKIEIPCPERKQELPKKKDDPPIPSITSVADKSMRKGGDSHHQTYAKVIFQNLRKVTIHMYSAGIVGGGGEFVNAMSIQANESESTNPLFVCYEDYNTAQELETLYKFYFYAVDEDNKKIFGSYQYSVKSYMVYTIPLSAANLVMSENGDRDQAALQRSRIL